MVLAGNTCVKWTEQGACAIDRCWLAVFSSGGREHDSSLSVYVSSSHFNIWRRLGTRQESKDRSSQLAVGAVSGAVVTALSKCPHHSLEGDRKNASLSFTAPVCLNYPSLHIFIFFPESAEWPFGCWAGRAGPRQSVWPQAQQQLWCAGAWRAQIWHQPPSSVSLPQHRAEHSEVTARGALNCAGISVSFLCHQTPHTMPVPRSPLSPDSFRNLMDLGWWAPRTCGCAFMEGRCKIMTEVIIQFIRLWKTHISVSPAAVSFRVSLWKIGKLGSFNTRQGANYISAGINMHKAAADHVVEGAGCAPHSSSPAPAKGWAHLQLPSCHQRNWALTAQWMEQISSYTHGGAKNITALLGFDH